MITIVLMDAENNYLECIGEANNQEYLLLPNDNDATYPLISELSDSDLDQFNSVQMPQLITELELLKQNLTDKQRLHVEDIIRLSRACQQNEDFTLGFTPFGEFLNNAITPTKI